MLTNPSVTQDRITQRSPLFIPSLISGLGVVIGIEWPFATDFYFAALILSLILWWRIRHLDCASWYSSLGIILFSMAIWSAWSVNESNFQQIDETFAEWTAEVLSVEDRKNGGKQAIVELVSRRNISDEQLTSLSCRVLLRLSRNAPEIETGALIRGAGSLDPITASLNPGQFDSKIYWERRGVHYRWMADNVSVIECTPSILQRCASELREKARLCLRRGIEDDPVMCGLLEGMLLGVRSGLPEPVERDFRRTGTYHLFAVSGQNVGLLVLAGLTVIEGVGLLRWRWGWILLPCLVLFVLVTGLQASAIRAATMAGAILTAWVLLRPVGALQLWSLAWMGMLIWDPGTLRDLGAQLSFSVVLSLILLTSKIGVWLYGFLPWDPLLPRSLAPLPARLLDGAWKMGSGLAGATFAAWLGSLPWMALVFHQVSLASLPANLMVVPLASLIVVSATIGLIFGLVHPALEAAVNNSVWLALKGMIAVVHTCAALPGGVWNVPAPANWVKVNEPEIVLLASGDTCTGLLRTGDEVWLVGAGSRYEVSRTVAPALRYYGINRIDRLILPALTASQAGGVEALEEEFLISSIAVPASQMQSSFYKQWWEAARQNHWQVEKWNRGDCIKLSDGMECRILSPVEGLESRRWEDQGMVFQIKRGEDRLMWGGNIGFGIERRLVRVDSDLSSCVLIQGRHGSEPNGSVEWRSALQPLHWIQPPRGFGAYRVTRETRVDGISSDGITMWDQSETGALVIQWKKGGGIEVRRWY